MSGNSRFCSFHRRKKTFFRANARTKKRTKSTPPLKKSTKTHPQNGGNTPKKCRAYVRNKTSHVNKKNTRSPFHPAWNETQKKKALPRVINFNGTLIWAHSSPVDHLAATPKVLYYNCKIRRRHARRARGTRGKNLLHFAVFMMGGASGVSFWPPALRRRENNREIPPWASLGVISGSGSLVFKSSCPVRRAPSSALACRAITPARPPCSPLTTPELALCGVRFW